MESGGCVYILTNKSKTVLYTGVTTDLPTRIWQHKNFYYPHSFTCRYKCTILVYFKFFPDISEARAEEYRIKCGSRASKLRLINELNPSWEEINDFW